MSGSFIFFKKCNQHPQRIALQGAASKKERKDSLDPHKQAGTTPNKKLQLPSSIKTAETRKQTQPTEGSKLPHNHCNNNFRSATIFIFSFIHSFKKWKSKISNNLHSFLFPHFQTHFTFPTSKSISDPGR